MPVGLNAQKSKPPGRATVVLPNPSRGSPVVACPAGALLSLLLLCSCATASHSPIAASGAKLPANVRMDKDTGRGNWLFVTLRLGSGEELPFFLDTGASGTCFDKSLERILGARQGTDTSWHFGHQDDAGVYLAPKLYLGGAKLEMTGPNVATIDLEAEIESQVGRPIAGVLGMDVLEHYCLQLDFAAREIRFLDADHADKSGWGKPFSLTNTDDVFPALGANLAGSHGPGSLLDTGCTSDGWLSAALYDQWTNHASAPAEGQVRSPSGALDGEVYDDMDLQRLDDDEGSSGDSHMKVNGIGLRFLSRHLVTFDFPNRMMYLKRTSAAPLSLTVREQRAAGRSVYLCLRNLKKRDQLPGWSKAEELPKSATFHGQNLSSGTLTIRKKGDSSAYHYWVTRASKQNPWQLEKAWRTDGKGRKIQEYAVP